MEGLPSGSDVVGSGTDWPERESAAPASADDGPFDIETDIVVVGSGGGGLPAALFSRWVGNDVVLLEKASSVGGTARRAAFWYWVPNNQALRDSGARDDEEDYLRYVARLSRPSRYDPASPTLGLTKWEYAMLQAIYQSASPAAELLQERGALHYRHCPDVVDYWSELPENKTPRGRVLVPRDACPSMSDGGIVATDSMEAAARRDGIDIRTSHRVQRAIVDQKAVVGVEASTPTTSRVRVRARKAVIFASGGFAHNADLRNNFIGFPSFSGAACAVPTNEGDFVSIAGYLGAQHRNMSHAWMGPMSMDRAVRRDPGLGAMSSAAGDSTIFVDKTGRRRVNEKLQYNELAQAFFVWDGIAGEYPNLVMIQVWDQRSQDHSAAAEYGRMIVPPGTDDSHVVTGKDLEELTEAVAERLSRYEHLTAGLRLSDEF